MRSISNPPEDKFLEAYNNWNVEKLFRDLADVNIEKKKISSTGKKYLRGVLVGKSPKHIAQICSLGGRDPSYTVRKYLSDEIYPLIRQLLNLSEKEPMVYNKVPFLLNEYSLKDKNQPHNHSQLTDISEASQETEQNEQLVNTSSDNPNWQTIEDVTLYIEKFLQHCEQEEYIQAFYTILDSDDYENCIHNFLSLRGYNNDIISLYERLVQSWQPRKSEKWEFGVSLALLGTAYRGLGRYQAAIYYYKRSLEIAEDINDFNTQAGSLVDLGLLYYLEKYQLGKHQPEEYHEAIKYIRSGLYIARQIGNRHFEAGALNTLGLVLTAIGERYKAIDYHHHSREIKQKIGDVQGEAAALINIGNNHCLLGQANHDLGEYQHALKFLQWGIEIAQQIGDHPSAARGWFILGLTKQQLEKKSEAIDAYKKACELFQEMGLDQSVQECIAEIQCLSEGIDCSEG